MDEDPCGGDPGLTGGPDDPPGPAGGESGPGALFCEGGVPFRSPSACAGDRGPGTKTGPAFYNRAMAPNRDLAVSVASALARDHSSGPAAEQPFRALDGLASSGVRGLRIAASLKGAGRCELTLNDVNPEAGAVMAENLRFFAEGAGPSPAVRPAGLEAGGPVGGLAAAVGDVMVTITREDIRALLLKQRFNYIDIDPYGSPAPFFAPALCGLYKGGVAGFTATDTPALCGVYPRTSLRRYGARSARSHFHHETGARILIGSAVRAAAAQDVAVQPVLVQSADHFIRVYLRRSGSATDADAVLGELGWVFLDRSTGRYWTAEKEGGGDGDAVVAAGPLWLGPLHDSALLESLEGEVGRTLAGLEAGDGGAGVTGEGVPGDAGWPRRLERSLRWLGTAKEEAGMPPFFHSVDVLCSHLKLSPPKTRVLREAFDSAGWRFSGSTFSPVGFRTDAPFGDVLDILRDTGKN